MMKAAIYARVSSERQAAEDRVSIEVQLAECEAYCIQRGYEIVTRYVDKEKYRFKGKLVQPSGQRKDRPQYVAMLRAAERGEFEVIVAWKEDRLYRGMYAAMPLSELLDEKGRRLDVELVKEQFDRKMLGIKAALGKIESDNIRERMMMGRRARLERGEVPGGDQMKYGYRKVEKHLEIEESEVGVIRQVMDWYIAGDKPLQIRRKLNEAGVPARRGELWSKATIENILTTEAYATGRLPTVLDGETFYIECPVIISAETWKKVQTTRQRNRFEARNRKEDFLCAGLVYCGCGWKCQTRASQPNRHRGYMGVQGHYQCQRRSSTPESLPDVCMFHTGSKKVDDYVWNFIRRVCHDPAVIGEAVRQKLAWLEAEQVNLEGEIIRLERQVDNLSMERQRVITFGRKNLITEEEMELQLMALRLQEMGAQRELDEKRRLAASKERSDFLSDWASRYLSEFRAGVESLDVDVEKLSEEERATMFEELGAAQYAERFPGEGLVQLKWAIFEEKRRTVRALVDRVIVSRADGPEKRKIVVVLDLNVPEEPESLAYGDQSPDAYDSLYQDRKLKLKLTSDEINGVNNG